jgi:hypothetical protein
MSIYLKISVELNYNKNLTKNKLTQLIAIYVLNKSSKFE